MSVIPRIPHVVVVGAGIIDAFTAYFLAKAGAARKPSATSPATNTPSKGSAITKYFSVSWIGAELVQVAMAVENAENMEDWEITRVIYTTNAIESVNMGLRKLTKNRGLFLSDEALTKLFYLALRNISQMWTMPIRNWKAALTRFTIQFGDRISVN